VEASAKGADVRGDEAAGNGVSSSSGVQGDQPAAAAAAESAAGGAVLPAPLPLLQRAELKVESIEDAADMIRLAYGVLRNHHCHQIMTSTSHV
jgi:hypothetical protein